MTLALKLHKSAGVPVTAAVHRHLQAANRARDAKDWMAAARGYRAALDQDSSLVHIWIQHGHALKETADLAGAEAAYRRAATLAPQSADPLLHLGHLKKQDGHGAEAIQLYLAAAKIDNASADALSELHNLVARGAAIDSQELLALLSEITEADTKTDNFPERGKGSRQEDDAASLSLTGSVTVFDASDLISYFRNARLPTGIQRVQIETITSALAAGRGLVKVCCFVEHRDEWLEIPAATFTKLCRLSLSDGDRTAPVWTAALSRLHITLNAAETFVFPDGAFLINLGTSWWLQNYFLFVRQAKAAHNIRYVPFVHDLIPVMAPEHCTKELTQDFISWIIGAFQHADFFLVNSEATKRDLIAVGQQLGHAVEADRIVIITLDADFRKPETTPPRRNAMALWGLDHKPFVLFVSTIESRKNHLAAFEAWMQLVRRHGAKRVPKLVCVGNRGWLNDAVYAQLAAQDVLRDQVVMLSGLSDSELALLYRECQFTLYPSRYEGWGLPVTESLCYGKVPLVSTAASLPEAGGAFAVYIDPNSITELTAALERLIFDPAYRQAAERKIQKEFQPRTWRSVAEAVEAAVDQWSQRPESNPTPSLPIARLAAFYPITRNFETRVWPGLASAEVFRADGGWWWPDGWGCWTKPQGGRLAIGLPPGHGPLRAYFRLHGLPGMASEFTIEISGLSRPLEGRLNAEEFKWLAIDLPSADTPNPHLAIRLRGESIEDLSTRTGGLDTRTIGVGFVGFFICEADDALARTAFLEAVSLGNIEDLAFNREPRHAGREETVLLRLV